MFFIRIFFYFLAAVSYLSAEPLSLSVNAESAILMNADTGVILYEKNARSLQYPASITKIATAAYVLKIRGDQLDEILVADQDSVAAVTSEAKRRANYTLPAYWLEHGGTHIGIKKGEELSLRDLLFGMMVASGNDASNVIAQHIGKTIPVFMANLNTYVKELGCENTAFCNPHGLHHPKHQTTAYDMALITKEALKNPMFCKIVSSTQYTRPKTNKQESTTLVQTNRLLRKGKYYYPKAIGVKTGTTSQAYCTLVAAAKHNDRTLIAVVLKSKESEDRWLDSIKMFEAAFNQAKVQRVLLKKGSQKFTLDLPGAAKPIQTYIQKDVSIEYYPAEEPKVKCLLYWDSLTLPIAQKQRVGELRLQGSNGRIIQTVPLFAKEEVKSTWLFWFKNLFGGFPILSFVKFGGVVMIFGLLCAFIFRRRA